MVLIGSHYDTVQTSPGVDDNGSGMTALLQALKLFTSLGTVTLLFFFLCLWSHRRPKLTMWRLYRLNGFQFFIIAWQWQTIYEFQTVTLSHNTFISWLQGESIQTLRRIQTLSLHDISCRPHMPRFAEWSHKSKIYIYIIKTKYGVCTRRISAQGGLNNR